MKITNSGRGVHKREIVGIEKLKPLPSNWYAYTNLDLALSPGKSREIDVIMVVDDRIFELARDAIHKEVLIVASVLTSPFTPLEQPHKPDRIHASMANGPAEKINQPGNKIAFHNS